MGGILLVQAFCFLSLVLIIQDLRLAILVGINCISKRLRCGVFLRFSIPNDSGSRGRGPCLPRPGTENPGLLLCRRALSARQGRRTIRGCRGPEDRVGGRITVWNTKRRTTANKSS